MDLDTFFFSFFSRWSTRLFSLTHFHRPYFCLLQLSIKKETQILLPLFSFLALTLLQNCLQINIFFSHLFRQCSQSPSKLAMFICCVLSQSWVLRDSGVWWVHAGRVAAAKGAPTHLVTSSRDSVSDIWNIRICVAARCGGAESTKTFDNTGLLRAVSRYCMGLTLQVNLGVHLWLVKPIVTPQPDGSLPGESLVAVAPCDTFAPSRPTSEKHTQTNTFLKWRNVSFKNGFSKWHICSHVSSGPAAASGFARPRRQGKIQVLRWAQTSLKGRALLIVAH